MLISCWSPKGGAGTSTVVAATAVALARQRRHVRVADLACDQAALLGVRADGAGIADWLAAGADAPPAALERVAVPVVPYLTLLPAGRQEAGAGDREAAGALAAALARDAVITIADLGDASPRACEVLARVADANLVVVRACYLSLHRLVHHRFCDAVDGIVLVCDRGRPLGPRDFVTATGRPVVAVLRARAALGRCTDAGLLPVAPDELLAPFGTLLRRMRSAGVLGRATPASQVTSSR